MLELIDAIVAVIGKVGGDGLGRTAIQKLVYFLREKKIVDAEYYAYFYGPYSAEVKGSLSSLVAYGFVDEKMELTPDNQRIYKYTLTKDGEDLLHKRIEKQAENQVERIEKVVNAAKEYSPGLGAVDLSVPAKTHFVLSEKNFMTVNDIEITAGKLGWKVERRQIKKSVRLLENLGLVISRPKQ